MSSRKLVSAIVGVGYWGKNYVRILSELKEETELICVCDLIPQAVAAFKQQYPELNTSTSIKEMLTTFPQIDLVVVVTPATTHFAVVKECLEAKKHVLVEKPLTIDIKQGQDLCKIAEENGVFLMCGHTFLFNKGVHKMKELMQEKEFGTPYVMYAKRTALGPIRFDVGADWDLVPHDVSIIQYLVSDEKPSTISAIGNNVLKSNKGLIDNVFITITYPSGLIANIHASWVDPEKVRQFVVVGSGRRIVFDDMNAAERVKYIDNGATEVTEEGGSTKIITNAQQTKYTAPTIAPFEPLKDQVKHFFQSVRENTKPTSDGKFGVVVVQIMQGIVQSIAQGGIPLSFESIEKQTQ